MSSMAICSALLTDEAARGRAEQMFGLIRLPARFADASMDSHRSEHLPIDRTVENSCDLVPIYGLAIGDLLYNVIEYQVFTWAWKSHVASLRDI